MEKHRPIMTRIYIDVQCGIQIPFFDHLVFSPRILAGVLGSKRVYRWCGLEKCWKFSLEPKLYLSILEFADYREVSL